MVTLGCHFRINLNLLGTFSQIRKSVLENGQISLTGHSFLIGGNDLTFYFLCRILIITVQGLLAIWCFFLQPHPCKEILPLFIGSAPNSPPYDQQ